MRSPGAVAVVPLVFDAEGNPSVVLVEQYRPPYERAILEIPAGMRDVAGEPTEETARRELAEEAGLAPGRLELLIELYPSPGHDRLGHDDLPGHRLHARAAASCTGPEEEHSRLLHVPLEDALAMIDDGRIADAKTVVGLLLTERRLRTNDLTV